MIALDSETNGRDFHHNTRPFYITTCNEEGLLRTWGMHTGWRVDPFTRKITPAEDDLQEIRGLLNAETDSHHGERKGYVLQNGRFDIQALTTIIPEVEHKWPFDITHDTLIAAHILASNKPKNLTTLAAMYLHTDISGYETELATAVQKARRLVQQAKVRAGKMREAHASQEGDVPSEEPKSKPVKVGLFSKPKVSRNLTKFRGPLDQLSRWMIAGEDLTDADGNYEMPSAGKQNWRADYWLPRAMIDELGAETIAEYSNIPLDELKRWPKLLEEYSDVDSQVTIQLWHVIERKLRERGLWAIYDARRKLSEIVYRMERVGVTMREDRLYELTNEYKEDSARLKAECIEIATLYGYQLDMPKNVNASLRTFVFDVMKLPQIRNKKAKTDAPALDAKNAIPYYLETLQKGSRERTFIESMVGMRKKNTALGFMEAYGRYACKLPTGKCHYTHRVNGIEVCRVCGCVPSEFDQILCHYRDYKVLYPNFNATGSDTLRFTCSNPNGQQISKQESECPHCEGEGCDKCHGKGVSLRSLRWMFGPAPGREWYSCDAQNIELRIPAYESGEQELIDLFERATEPPYFGSEHLLNFSTIYPDIWAAELDLQMVNKDHIKTKYKSTWYQYCKNFGFAVGYGAVDRPDGAGTADMTAKRAGSQSRVKSRFAKKEQLNQQCIRFAEKWGYVETIPDKTIDPKRGYPLMCSRTDRGSIKPTVPLNYHVQGTAMWWMFKAMLRVSSFFQRINAGELFAGKVWKGGYHIVLQVHDELVLDMPKRVIPGKPLHTYNAPIVAEVRRLMESGGQDISIPTPVSCSYHLDNWAEETPI